MDAIEARRLAEIAVDRVGAPLSAHARGTLAEALAIMLHETAREERERCVDACRRRAELWSKTAQAKSPAAAARDEARARANEAEYLADLLAQGTDLGAGDDDEVPH